jgi:hypothetical protein
MRQLTQRFAGAMALKVCSLTTISMGYVSLYSEAQLWIPFAFPKDKIRETAPMRLGVP